MILLHLAFTSWKGGLMAMAHSDGSLPALVTLRRVEMMLYNRSRFVHRLLVQP